MLVTAIVLAIIVALLDNFLGPIKEPWRKIIWAGIIVLFIIGLIQIFLPGVFPVMRL